MLANATPPRAERPGCVVVKLGGGLLTGGSDDEPQLDMVRLDTCLADLAALPAAGQPLVLVHGTGTFGKPPARLHGYLDGRLGVDRAHVVSKVGAALAAFENRLLARAEAAGLRPVRVPAFVLFESRHGTPLLRSTEAVQRLLAHGLTPVIGGGFVFDEPGFAVCSSDRIAVDLALALPARALVLATRAHGVYRDGESHDIHAQLGASDLAALEGIREAGHDVSGGMRAKVEQGLRAAAAGIASFVIDGRRPGNIPAALAGRPLSGTRLLGSGSQPLRA